MQRYSVCWRDDGHVLRKALEFEVKRKRKRGQLRKTWISQVEKESKSGENLATLVYGDKTGSKLDR